MLNRANRVSIFQHPIFLAITFFFLSMGIHLIGIDALSLTSDECFSIYHAQMSPRLIYHHLSTGNNPPLHEWILHYWMLCFGDSAFSVRFLSLIFSSLTTALIFILGTRISAGLELLKVNQPSGADANPGTEQTNEAAKDRNTNYPNVGLGSIAAILFLASNYTGFLAHEARTYNLTLFLGVLSTISFIDAMKSGKIRDFLLYGLVGGLLCLSHFFGIWILLAQGSFWIFGIRVNNPKAKSMVGAVLGFGISFGWYIPNLWYRFVDSASQGTWVNPAPWDAPYLTLWKYFNNPVATILVIVLLISLTVFLIKYKSSRGSQNHILIFLTFALPFFGQWILSLNHPLSIPMFTERYASITLPFLCLSVSMSLSIIPTRLGSFDTFLKPLPLIIVMLLGKNFTPPNQASAREAIQNIQTKLGHRWNEIPIVLEPYYSAFQMLYYIDHKRFKQHQNELSEPQVLYDHLASQLSRSNVWIMKTTKSLDSLGLSNNKRLTYLHFGTEKSAHTKAIEQQLEELTTAGGNIQGHTIHIPKKLWGTTEITAEAEFWLIEKK